MPRSAPRHNPHSHLPKTAPKKAFENSTTAAKRVTGRALQARNARIQTRDGYRCQVCGAVITDGEVDHRIPLAEGGTEDDANLQWLCRTPCHAEKSRQEATRGCKTWRRVPPRG